MSVRDASQGVWPPLLLSLGVGHLGPSLCLFHSQGHGVGRGTEGRELSRTGRFPDFLSGPDLGSCSLHWPVPGAALEDFPTPGVHWGAKGEGVAAAEPPPPPWARPAVLHTQPLGPPFLRPQLPQSEVVLAQPWCTAGRRGSHLAEGPRERWGLAREPLGTEQQPHVWLPSTCPWPVPLFHAGQRWLRPQTCPSPQPAADNPECDSSGRQRGIGMCRGWLQPRVHSAPEESQEAGTGAAVSWGHLLQGWSVNEDLLDHATLEWGRVQFYVLVGFFRSTTSVVMAPVFISPPKCTCRNLHP